ncbi:MAG TPA: hypothetical protein DDZ40_06130, partial [Deltaproteobacteria bacterium]|nr:hypothetical protein [Deltaproteobacteria bacterium]
DMSLDVPAYDGSDETLMDRISSGQDVEEIVSEQQRVRQVENRIIKRFKTHFQGSLVNSDLKNITVNIAAT